MADRTKIEWTEATWTPLRARWFEPQSDGGGKERVGWHCEHVSEGCRNCYAEGINRRLGTGLDFKPGNLHRPDRAGYANGEAKVFLDERMLLQPLRWARPRRIFVCSMTDLFASFVPDEMIDRIFAVIAASHQHTFQILTKRPERMRRYLSDPTLPLRLARTWCSVGRDTMRGWSTLSWIADGAASVPRRWPLPNVWVGTSCEDQAAADARVPDLLATPAAIRFVSAEPLLGPIDFEPWLAWPDDAPDVGEKAWGCQDCDAPCDCPKGKAVWLVREGPAGADGAPERITCDRATLDWIIVGGESGRGARPMRPQWARSIRDQCRAVGVAFLFKQHGDWLFEDQVCDGQHPSDRFFLSNGSPVDEKPPFGPATGRLWHWWDDGGFASIRVGKKAAGRLLDGRTHDGMPQVRP